MKTSLYNQDGTLSAQAQSLLSPKPLDMSIAEWKKTLKIFKDQLAEKEIQEFSRLKRNADRVRGYRKNREKELKARANYYQNNREKELTRQAKYHRDQKKRSPNQPAQAELIEKKLQQERLKTEKDIQRRLKKEKKLQQERIKKEKDIQRRLKEEKIITPDQKKRRKWRNDYHQRRRLRDPLYRLLHNMRVLGNRIVKQLALGNKPASTEKWQGCTAEELKTHLEGLFTEGMTWDNYGKDGWHVDHIRPVSSFAPEEWEEINHYTNLQPLWAEDNLRKRAKWN